MSAPPIAAAFSARHQVAHAWYALSRDHRDACGRPITHFAREALVQAIDGRSLADWRQARLHAVLGQAEDAVFHARRCYDRCRMQRSDIHLMGHACVVMAWGLRLLGRAEASDHHLHLAACLFAYVDDPVERERAYEELSALHHDQPVSHMPASPR